MLRTAHPTGNHILRICHLLHLHPLLLTLLRLFAKLLKRLARKNSKRKEKKKEMKLVKAYNSVSLVLRIVIGMVIGTALALLIPNAAVTAPGIGILGKLFVGALKAIAPLLVFVLIISALAQSKEKMGKQFGTVIALYLVSTFLAAVIAVAASYLFPVTITLTEAASDSAPESFAEIFTNLLTNIVSNPIGSIVSGNFLGILFWAIVLGFAFKGAADSTKRFLADASEAVTKAVRFVINLAPFGILGLVFTAVSTSGLAIFTEYGKLLLLLVGCMLFSALVVNPIMAFIAMRKNPYPLVFKCLKESGVTAFFTRSSAANIPVNMSLCESLGLDKEFYSVSIPLGATINMAGAAVTITIMALAAALRAARCCSSPWPAPCSASPTMLPCRSSASVSSSASFRTRSKLPSTPRPMRCSPPSRSSSSGAKTARRSSSEPSDPYVPKPDRETGRAFLRLSKSNAF